MNSFKRPPWCSCERTCVKWVMVASQGRSLRSYVEAHQKHWGTESHFTFQIANNDQIARMHLSCSQATKSGVFLRRGPYDVEAQASMPSPGYAPASMSNIHRKRRHVKMS